MKQADDKKFHHKLFEYMLVSILIGNYEKNTFDGTLEEFKYQENIWKYYLLNKHGS